MLDTHIEGKVISSGDAAGRMNDQGVAEVGSFGIKVALHAQGTAMCAMGKDGALTAALVAERERGLPAPIQRRRAGGNA